MSVAPSQLWDLESIYAGGPAGQAFDHDVQRLEQRLVAIKATVDALGPLEGNQQAWKRLLAEMITFADQMGTAGTFASCHWSADAHNEDARAAAAKIAELRGDYSALWVPLKLELQQAPQALFDAFVGADDMADSRPWLERIRLGRALVLPKEQEALYVQLEREALHGWGQLYAMISGKLMANVATEEGSREVSIAELRGLLSSPDEPTRKAGYEAGEAAWESVSAVCAHSLTQITGARQTRLDRLGANELADTLYSNRIEQGTLSAIWAACDVLKPQLVRYLDRKAALLGKEKLDWWDLTAPIQGGDMASLSWERAQELVLSSFEGFDPKMAAFAASALKGSWVEAEARSGKRPGGYCARVPRLHQSRIFMSFTGNLNSAMTLAHELGHAYHNELLFDQPREKMHITMSLAETASTFAEAIVLDRVLASADDDLRLFLIESQLQRGVAFLMNIPARFAFERHLYSARRKGALRAADLNEQTVRFQQQAYGDALGSYSPTFWMSKLHFYISHFGFYNWPYTFGYLFSQAVYRRSLQEGKGFSPTFEDLLLRTGYQPAEVLASEVLGADLTDAAFWIGAAEPLNQQVSAFLELTEA